MVYKPTVGRRIDNWLGTDGTFTILMMGPSSRKRRDVLDWLQAVTALAARTIRDPEERACMPVRRMYTQNGRQHPTTPEYRAAIRRLAAVRRLKRIRGWRVPDIWLPG